MGKVVRGVVGAVLTVVGVATGNFGLAAAGLSMTLGALAKTPSFAQAQNQATEQRLSKSIEPEAFRKIVFGETAGGCDMRYWEVWTEEGDPEQNDRYIEIIAVASHDIEEFGAFYVNDELVPFDEDGHATNSYGEHLERKDKKAARHDTGQALGTGTKWTIQATMTGCAFYVLSYVVDQEHFPNGIPSRYTQVIKGAKVYDPRRDTTVGGSGTHRYNDQSTWSYATLDSNGVPIGRNNALQQLWYLLGWRVTCPQAPSRKVLVAGRGVDPTDIDFASFIAAANDCEAEHYYTDCILSTGDSHSTNQAILSAGAGGQLLDTGGLWSYRVAVDDTADVAVALNDDDVVGEVEWVPCLKMQDQFNEVAGTFIDPSDTSLYQPKAFPVVTDDAYVAADGYRKRKTLTFQSVQDHELAQKLARIELNRNRRQGVFKSTFNYKALKARNYDCITLSLARYGWVDKLFRVVEQGLSPLGGVEMILREEDAAVYAGGTVLPLDPPSKGLNFDPRTKPVVSGFTATPVSVDGDSDTTRDGVLLSIDLPPPWVARTKFQYRKSGDSKWVDCGGLRNAVGSTELTRLVAPLQPKTSYEFKATQVSKYHVTSDAVTATAKTSGFTADKTFAPRRSWDFESTAQGWTASNATLSVDTAKDLLTVTPTSTDAQLLSPAISYGGGKVSVVRARVRAHAATITWTGELKYSTSGHGFSDSYKLATAKPTKLDAGKWTVLEWDMNDQATDGVGGTDYLDSTITGLRIDLSDDGTVFDVDWIAVGKMATDPVGARSIGDNADQTSANTAASIVGQGALATKNQVDFTTDVINASLAGLDAKAARDLVTAAYGLSIGDVSPEANWDWMSGTADSWTASAATLSNPSTGGLRATATGTGVQLSSPSSLSLKGNRYTRLLIEVAVQSGSTTAQALRWVAGDGTTFTTGSVLPVGGNRTIGAGVREVLVFDLPGDATMRAHWVGQTVSQLRLDLTASGSGAQIDVLRVAAIGKQSAKVKLGKNIYSSADTLQADADLITISGTAASITGQGTLATRGTVLLGTHVKNAANTLTLGDADLITISGTAASITGQGTLATRGTVLLGSHVRNAADTTTLGDAVVITSQGTAASITGQGALATRGTVAAAHIDPAAVTPSKLAAQADNNLLVDAGYIDVANTWALGSGVAKHTAADGSPWDTICANAAADAVLGAVGNGTTSQPNVNTFNSAFIRAEPGKKYVVVCPVAWSAGTTAQGFATVHCYDKDGVPIGNDIGNTTVASGRTTALASAGAETLRFQVKTRSVAGGDLKDTAFIKIRLIPLWSTTLANAGALAFGQVKLRRAMELGSNADLVDSTGTALADAAVVTSQGTAASITGQGTLATRGTVLLGSHVRNAADTTTLGDAVVITSQGTAASITGQGTLATKSLVTASLLARHDASNLVPDPAFIDTAYWTASGTGAIATDTNLTSTLTSAQGFKATATSSTTQPLSTLTSGTFAVKKNCKYAIDFETLVLSGFKGLVYVQIAWSNGNGAPISTSTVTGVDYRTVAAGSDTAATISGAVQAPSTAAMATLQVGVLWPSGTLSAGTAYGVNPRMFKAAVLGQTVTKEDGTTTLTDALVVTSLGVATGISSQGALATKNFYDITDVQTVDLTASAGIIVGTHKPTLFMSGANGQCFFKRTGATKGDHFTLVLGSITNVGGVVTLYSGNVAEGSPTSLGSYPSFSTVDLVYDGTVWTVISVSPNTWPIPVQLGGTACTDLMGVLSTFSITGWGYKFYNDDAAHSWAPGPDVLDGMLSGVVVAEGGVLNIGGTLSANRRITVNVGQVHKGAIVRIMRTASGAGGLIIRDGATATDLVTLATQNTYQDLALNSAGQWIKAGTGNL